MKCSSAIFLTEGSRTMGFGHLTRCLSLSQAFKEKGFSSTFIVQGDDSIEAVMQGQDLVQVNWLESINSIKPRLQNAFVIIDTFSISEAQLDELSALTRITILDDYIRRDHTHRLVIDWTINAEKKFFPEKNITSHYLLGHDFIALRQPFWDRPKFIAKPIVNNILITFGGGDIRDLTPQTVTLLQNNYPSATKTVIIGRGYQNRAAIEASADSRTTIILDADAPTMMRCMANADVAIAAGGQTLYELACIGVPTISVTLIDNQLDDIEGWQETGFTSHAGWWDDPNLKPNILTHLHNLEPQNARQARALIGQNLVDGQGARRVVNAILLFEAKP